MLEVQEVDNAQAKVPVEKAVKEHGVLKLTREIGMSYPTLRDAMKGLRTPMRTTAERIAEGLGLGLDDLDWPLGYREPVNMKYGPGPRSEPVDLYEDEKLKAQIEDFIDRAVEKRFAELVAQQADVLRVATQKSDEQTSSQSQER